jgi:hypothetical protein
MMEEIWKDIKGFEGLYKVSNLGRVLSLKKNVIMKENISNSGYVFYGLYKDGIVKSRFVHRLVAQTFIDNLENKIQVNHMDLNRKNNSIENLEWVTISENQKHSYKNSNRKSYMKGRAGKLNHLSKEVVMCDNNGIEIKRFESQREAGRIMSINASHINNVIKNKRNHAGGFVWRNAI